MNNFTISRTFTAPRSLVFDCWVKPEHFEKWGLAPAGCTCRLLHADVRPGGYYHIQQGMADGKPIHSRVDFREVSPIDRLVFVVSLCDEKGETVNNPFFPDWPRTLLTTVNFEDGGSGTKVTVIWELLDASAAEAAFFSKNLRIGHQGWSETFDRLQTTIEAAQPVPTSTD
ncbi:MAG TPA: SRPBCC domain-containing protein [Fimbriimonadaceae bacterium]|nr:SRPBCC domain-containing protein [Fimbriimonadaceae bacterium]